MLGMKERGNKYLRFLDRWLGIPLLFFLALFRRRRSFPQEVRRVGVMKLAGIGDVVLLGAWMGAMREVVFFCGKGNRAMADLLGVDKVVELDVGDPVGAMRAVRAESLDVFYDAESWSRFSALLALFSKTFSVGFKSEGQLRHFGFDRVVEHRLTRHESENFGALLGLEKAGMPPPRKGGEGIVVHMFAGGSRSYLKEWPHWRELFSLLDGEAIYATGAAKDFERIEEVTEGFPVKNVAGQLSLSETADLLQRVRCVVSVDTGIMHLAAALGVKTVCLHGPTSPKRWGGLGENVRAVTPKRCYAPCLQFGFEKGCRKNFCMHSITPKMVLHEIRQ